MPAILPTWAATGNIVPPDPSKISVGWLLGEKPPHEYMNWWQNIVTQRVNHVLSRGIPEWDSSISYQSGALAKGAGGLVYRALVNNTNQNPASSPAAWIQVTENASALSSGTVPNARIVGEYTGFTNLTASGTITAAQHVGGGAGLTNLNATNLASGTVPNARIAGAYTGFTNITASGAITAATFAGNGAALTSLNASQLATGTVADARLPNTMTGKDFTTGIKVAFSGGSPKYGFSGQSGGAAGMHLLSTEPGLDFWFGGALRMRLSDTALTAIGDVIFTGNGSGLTALNAGQLTSGTVPNARIAGAYNGFTNVTLSGLLSAENIVAAKNIGTDSAAGGFIYVNNTDGYFRAPSTSGVPLFTFNGDTNTGWGRAGANALSGYVGGVESLRIGTNVTILNGGSFAGAGSALTNLNASALASGTVATARLPDDAAADAWVGARYSDMAHNGIGMIAYATDMVNRSTGYGSSRPASDLRLANPESAGGGGTLPGTAWRCLFYCQADSDADNRTGPWQRIS